MNELTMQKIVLFDLLTTKNLPDSWYYYYCCIIVFNQLFSFKRMERFVLHSCLFFIFSVTFLVFSNVYLEQRVNIARSTI